MTGTAGTAGAAARQWILVADDDQASRERWAQALRAAGYAAVEARTGHEVLELMRLVVPHLVLLDPRMPELGEGFLRRLGGSPVLREIPVLLAAGRPEAGPPDVVGLRVAGHVAKPVAVDRLLASVADALARHAPRLPLPSGVPPRY